MEVSIVSDQFIMPPCGTHKHPNTHLLSFLDQTISALMPILLFYSSGEIHVDADMIKKRVESLKQSLSKTLASFYPFAGRLSDDKKSILCSDEGVYFVEASVNSDLSTFLQRPDLFHKLIPAAASDNNNIVGAVQVTIFTCGGMTIGASISHTLVDASAYSFFLRSWAATANDDTEHRQLSAPNFDSSTVFPPTDYSFSESSSNVKSPMLRRGRSVTKRVVFDAEAIVSLKAKASIPTCKQSPSRVEAVSAFICKATAAAMRARSGKTKPLYTTFTVNMRRRAIPSFPESCMGSYAALATVALGTVDQDSELADLVVKTREEINKSYNSDFVKSLRGEPAKLFELYKEKGVFADPTTLRSAEPEVEYISFNSWCNMGFYDVDFGWGKPIWIMPPNPENGNRLGEEYFNYVLFMDTRSRDGSMEAWISCHEEDIGMMEQDEEFIAFATFQSHPTSL